MSSTFNKPESVKRRKYLRRNMTKAEKILWTKLRNCRLSELRFRRQYGVYNYVIDFYCPAFRLAIEIIGDVHGYSNQIKSDAARKKKIESLGIKILVYTNLQVIEETERVLQDILSNLPLTPSFIRRGRARKTRS
jgi:very-short-patch-repair endonuclease